MAQEVCDGQTIIHRNPDNGRPRAVCGDLATKGKEGCGFSKNIRGHEHVYPAGYPFYTDETSWFVSSADMEDYHRLHVKRRSDLKQQKELEEIQEQMAKTKG